MGLDPKQFEGVEWLRKLGIHVDNNSVRVDAHFGSNASAAPPSVPVIDVPPTQEPQMPDRHVEHITLDYETEPVRKQARDAFVDEKDIFLNLWLTAAGLALAGVPDAEEPESRAGWWIALGGNLVWAATCLVPQAKVVAIVLMSFGGAIAGSGAFSPNNEKAPSGKELISGKLSDACTEMKAKAGPVLDLAATYCGDKQIVDKEEQRKILWAHLFDTPYNDSGPITRRLAEMIRAGLKSYNEQWHSWKKEVDSVAKKYADDAPKGGLDYDAGGPGKEDYDRAMKEHPFRPKIRFN